MEPVGTAAVLWNLTRKFWWVLPVVALAVCLVVMNSKLKNAQLQLAKEQSAHNATKANFAKTVADYRAASALALQQAEQEALRVKQQQERETQETLSEYKALVADTDQRYRSLQQRAKTFASNSSSASQAGVSLASAAACGAYAGTTCEEIPSLLREAEMNTNQLLALQQWVERQSKVKVSAEPAPRD